MSTKQNINRKTLLQLEKMAGARLTLGSLIRAIRLSEEQTQVNFALRLGVSKQFLCDVERGRRVISPQKAAEFAHLLGYSEIQFVRLCLQEMIDRAGIKLTVEVHAA